MYRIDAEAHGDWKQIGAVISTIDDGSITLPASSSKLTTSRNSTQPMPPVLDPGGHRLHGICSLVIRLWATIAGGRMEPMATTAAPPNSIEIYFPGIPTKTTRRRHKAGFASFFGAAEHL